MISTRTRAILSLAGVFLLGVIFGGGALGLYLRGQVRDSQSMNDPAAFRGFIEERLRLTEAQRDSLQDELGATYEDLAALRGATAEEYTELIDSFSTRVAPQLDPDQRQLLGRLEERMRKRFSRGAVRAPHKRGSLDSLEIPSETSALRPQPARSADTLQRAITKVQPRDVAQSPKRATPPIPDPLKPIMPSGDSIALNGVDLENTDGRLARIPLPNVDTLGRRLVLTTEQIGSIRKVVRETREKVRADQEQLRGFRRLQKEALRRNLLYMDARIEALLEPEQRVEYRAHRAELHRRFKPGKQRSAGGKLQ